MIVYQVLADGAFGGEVVADEHPLREGEYLIPAGCVSVKPPSKPGHWAFWNGKSWYLQPLPSSSPAPETPEAPVLSEWDTVREKAAFLLRCADEAIASAVTAGSVIPQEWRDYRSALADIREQAEGDPDAITWPVQPNPIELPTALRSFLYKTDIISRMEDAELEAFAAALATSATRIRFMWDSCQRVEAQDPLFALLQQQLTDAFGAERSAAILSLDS